MLAKAHSEVSNIAENRNVTDGAPIAIDALSNRTLIFARIEACREELLHRNVGDSVNSNMSNRRQVKKRAPDGARVAKLAVVSYSKFMRSVRP